MKLQNRSTKIGFLLLLIGFTAAMSYQRPATSGPQTLKVDPLAARIVARIEPLCRTLFPEQETMHFVTSPQTTYRKDGFARHMWWVDCLDANEKNIVHILWNEDTQRLVIVSRTQSDHSRLSAPTTPAQAVTAARKWVMLLDLATKNDIQNSAYKVHRLGDTLCIQLYPSSGEVIVWVNAKSGEVVNTHAHTPGEPPLGEPIAGEDRATPHA